MHTFYYLNYIAPSQLLQGYFQFMQSPRFKRLADIPRLELGEYIPTRVMPGRVYSNDGRRLILPDYLGRRCSLSKMLDKLVYEYSASKLTMREIAQRLSQELGIDMPPYQMIPKYLLPVYRKLEERCQVVFYR